jgi:hypothetical protein
LESLQLKIIHAHFPLSIWLWLAELVVVAQPQAHFRAQAAVALVVCVQLLQLLIRQLIIP